MKNWKDKLPNKIKEGIYQYLSNILLCNIGAGIALFGMDKFGVKSRSARLLGILAGVVAIGLYGGGAIANFIGKTIINPIINRCQSGFYSSSDKISLNNLNDERHPEPIDLSVHLDDLVSVGFISGLKWIGPVLPVLYSVSGYRAGVGYRNGNKNSFKIPQNQDISGVFKKANNNEKP